MKSPSSRYSSISQLLNEPSEDSVNMTTLTLRPSFNHFPSMRWEESIMNLSSRPRSQPSQDRIELPSIRQAVPEIQLRGIRADLEPRSEQHPRSPVEIGSPFEFNRPVSSNKRRRYSNEDDADSAREHLAPRLYRSPSRPQRSQSAALSPKMARRESVKSTAESWSGGSARTSPYSSAQRLPAMRSPRQPDTASSSSSRSEWWPSLPVLPSLPALSLDRKSPQHQPWTGEYALDPARLGAQSHRQQSRSPFDSPTLPFQQSSFSYGYQQPRGQSSSGPPTSNTISNTPFSSNSYHSNYTTGNFPYGLDLNDMGNDNKQRKRRGNLPKETTDTLRAWFHDHLQHPYPTEDEKQELMRRTGLQLNQISNWFINARRRQLPAMINNARVESGATSARGVDGALKSGFAGKSSAIAAGDRDRNYDEEYPGRSSSEATMKRENTL